MSRENISIPNFLSTFGMACVSCLNNLCLSRDQRERLFDQFPDTTDGLTREQIMLQLFTMTQQESTQMQHMLDISRSMSKAYADLVSNFISTLKNLVLIRRDAYLHHAHLNLDAFRLRNLCAALISGGDLFERSLTQEYEQHLIGLGVKPGSKKEQCFHPYKKNKTSTGSTRGILSTHAGSTIYGARALLSTSTPRWSQRRMWQSQRVWPRRQHRW